jgi:predicted nucleotidyltransferase
LEKGGGNRLHEGNVLTTKQTTKFLEHFTQWARSRADIIAVALVGSHARDTARPDSDIDIVMLCKQPTDYLAHLDWVQAFGTTTSQQLEDYGKLTSVRTWYGDGLEVEFGITDEHWADLPLDEGTRKVISDGMVILLDRDGPLSKAQAANHQR